MAEGIGTAFLLMAVVGSGIMGERLAGGNVAVTLLANSLATGCALAALIVTFAPLSGAHFNPLVSLAKALSGGMVWPEFAGYVVAQVGGGLLGVAIANRMFGPALMSISTTQRAGSGQLLGEFVATFGLLIVVLASDHFRAVQTTAAVVGVYITSAYWFTSSTSFANPAVTLARTVTDSFAGIAPASVAGFLVAQVLGAVSALLVFRLLAAPTPRRAVTGIAGR